MYYYKRSPYRPIREAKKSNVKQIFFKPEKLNHSNINFESSKSSHQIIMIIFLCLFLCVVERLPGVTKPRMLLMGGTSARLGYSGEHLMPDFSII